MLAERRGGGRESERETESERECEEGGEGHTSARVSPFQPRHVATQHLQNHCEQDACIDAVRHAECEGLDHDRKEGRKRRGDVGPVNLGTLGHHHHPHEDKDGGGGEAGEGLCIVVSPHTQKEIEDHSRTQCCVSCNVFHAPSTKKSI